MNNLTLFQWIVVCMFEAENSRSSLRAVVCGVCFWMNGWEVNACYWLPLKKKKKARKIIYMNYSSFLHPLFLYHPFGYHDNQCQKYKNRLKEKKMNEWMNGCRNWHRMEFRQLYLMVVIFSVNLRSNLD